MGILRSCLCAFLTLALGAAEPARPAELGTPFIRNFAQKEYGGDFQNWSIVQDHRGLIYVANNMGVLEYDGVRWRLIRTPKSNVVRSLTVDAQGRVYVGGVGEIGYLDPGPDLETRYVSLNGLLAPADASFGDVWVTAATPRGILFQTRERLLLLEGQRIRSIDASSSFHVAFVVQNRIFVRQRGLGLMELRDGQLDLVPGGARFSQESVFTMLPAEGGSILLGSRNLGFWRLSQAGLTPFPTEADAFLKVASLYGGTRLGDGTLALATLNGGVALLDGQGRLKTVVDRTSGLQGDNVKGLCADRQGYLWVALDNGIARVDWPSRLSLFDERQGLRGSVWYLHRHRGTLYAATGQGLFALGEGAELPTGGPFRRASFHQVPGITVQSLSLLSVDDTLLLASGMGVSELRGDRVQPIWPSSSTAITIIRSNADPERVFIGLQGGLASMRRQGRTWVNEGQVPGISCDIFSIVEDAGGRLWLGAGSHGVLRVTLPQGWRGGATAGAPRIETFTASHGLPTEANPLTRLVAGAPRVSTHQGLFQFNDAQGRFEPDPRFQALFPQGPRFIRAISSQPDGQIWLDTVDEVRKLHESGVAIPQPDGSLRWDPAPFRHLADFSFEALLVEPGGRAWLGGPGGAVRYDPDLAAKPTWTGRPIIRRASARTQNLLSSGQVLAFADNALRFEFAAPALGLPSSEAYQVRLDGHDQAWSPWTGEAQKEYTNLPEGSYAFRIRARGAQGQLEEALPFAFRIRPPWHRTWWAYLGYLGLGSGLLRLGFGLRVRLLKTRNAELQERVIQATEEVRDRERMLAAQAGALSVMNGDLQGLNQRLKELNEQKDRFLGIVVHDLRNPLNAILLSAQMLEENPVAEDAQRRAATISGQAAEMSLLIDRFLDIATLDAGRVQPEPETFPMVELLGETLERHGARARQKGIQLRLEPAAGLGLVLADRRFLRSVLDNLVSNALKFTPSGREVTLSLEERDATMVATVADQGPGLTEADQRMLFGRFSKLSARPTAGEKSVGLGLSIAKELVEATGGRIWVESVPGNGARFHVALPLAQAESGVI